MTGIDIAMLIIAVALAGIVAFQGYKLVRQIKERKAKKSSETRIDSVKADDKKKGE